MLIWYLPSVPQEAVNILLQQFLVVTRVTDSLVLGLLLIKLVELLAVMISLTVLITLFDSILPPITHHCVDGTVSKKQCYQFRFFQIMCLNRSLRFFLALAQTI